MSKCGLLTPFKNLSEIRGIQKWKHYIYLSINVSLNRNITSHIKELKMICYKQAWRIATLPKSTLIELKINLLKCLIHSKIIYMSNAIISKSAGKQLDIILRQTTRIALGLASNTYNEVFMKLLNSPVLNDLSYSDSISKLVKSFNRKICSEHNKRCSQNHLKEKHMVNIGYDDVIDVINT